MVIDQARQRRGGSIVALADSPRLQQRHVARSPAIGAPLQAARPDCAFRRRRANHADLIGVFVAVAVREMPNLQPTVGAVGDAHRAAVTGLAEPFAGAAILADRAKQHALFALGEVTGLIAAGVSARWRWRRRRIDPDVRVFRLRPPRLRRRLIVTHEKAAESLRRAGVSHDPLLCTQRFDHLVVRQVAPRRNCRQAGLARAL
jgi:hypothetical protein